MTEIKTVAQIAEELGLTRAGVYWKIQRGELQDVNNESGQYLLSTIPVLTISEAARKLLVTQPTIKAWCKIGRLDKTESNYIVINNKFLQLLQKQLESK